MEMLRRTKGVNHFDARIPRARFVFLGGLLALFPLMLGAQAERPGATVANDPLRVHPEVSLYYQKTKPKQHPMGMTGAPIPNKALFESPADWISPTGGDGYNADPPPADGRKVIISDVDHVWPKDYRRWVWKSFTRGLHTAFMDLYGATRIGDKDVKTFTFEEGRLRL
jgi:hypothetical protein